MEGLGRGYLVILPNLLTVIVIPIITVIFQAIEYCSISKFAIYSISSNGTSHYPTVEFVRPH